MRCRLTRPTKNGQGIDLNNQLNIYNITFEIQVKSAFEHAWAVSTHDLVYKSPEIDWKRLRLAAQIKANVEQLDTLILAFEQTSAIIQENHSPDLNIDNNSIFLYNDDT